MPSGPVSMGMPARPMGGQVGMTMGAAPPGGQMMQQGMAAKPAQPAPGQNTKGKADKKVTETYSQNGINFINMISTA